MTNPERSGLLTLVTRTANQLGSGQADGVVDQAIFREHNTRLPAWPGSAMKGSLRSSTRPEATDTTALEAWNEIFGPEPSAAGPGQMGILHLEDAHLLALPVPTPAAALAWVTSPYLLRALRTECDDAGIALHASGMPVERIQPGTCIAPQQLWAQGSLWLADLAFRAPDGDANRQDDFQAARSRWARALARHWYAGSDSDWQAEFTGALVIVPDNAMRHLASLLGVRPRIKIATQGGDPHLWFEEVLPDHVLMWSRWSVQALQGATHFKPDMAAAVAWVTEGKAPNGIQGLPGRPEALQVGGKASTGKGRVGVGVLHASLKAVP